MKHSFHYVKTGIWYRPIIPVSLRFNRIELRYVALLDSGADFNIFHGDIARILKINLKTLKNTTKFSGIKQGAEGVGAFASVELGINSEYKDTVVIFSDDISENGYGILGQQGFYNNYDITFKYAKKEITLVSS